MQTKTSVLAGGCFWGLQELTKSQSGVLETQVGYANGAEAVSITYDPDKTSFRQLLDFFFRVHDPTTLNQQGNDVGQQYRSAIFYSTIDELEQAEAFIKIVNDSGRWNRPVVTTVEPLMAFTLADASHQDYLQKNPDGYTCHRVRFNSYL
jgi:peptide-methionine (S)-S-oxide reductase